jgi:spore maturation protein CgeB
LYDPEAEAVLHVPPPCGAATLVFLGCGLGLHVRETLARNPQATRVVLIERHPELAPMAARAAAEAAPEIRLDVVAPVDGREPTLPGGLDTDRLQMVVHPPSFHAHPAWYGRWQARVVAAATPSTPSGGAGPLPGMDTAVRTPGKRRLTVLVLSGGFYCQAEAIHGLEAGGHRVVALDYRRDEPRFLDDFRRVLLEQRPDLVVDVNLKGLVHPEAMTGLLGRLGIPLAAWFVDSPEFILDESVPLPRDLTRILVWDRSYLPGLRALGFTASHLPLAADEALVPAARREPRFEAPVGFVGNSLAVGVLAQVAARLPRTGQVARLREEGVARVLGSRGRHFPVLDAFLEAHAGALPPGDAPRWLRAAILHGATSAYRVDLLRRLLPLGLRIFGDPEGWRRVLGPDAPVHPDVSYFEEAPAVYASCAVNLSATSLQMPGAVNQRCFDVPLCGGFLLTDRQEELFELFAEDEVATYQGPDDVADQAREWLGAPARRREISTRARARVLGEHTYRRRMQQLVEAVFAR